MPRSYYLTFGFHCDRPRINSLKGFRYDISFTNQSNEINSCTEYALLGFTGECSKFYRQTTLPNLVGDSELDKILEYLKLFKVYEVAVLKNGRCYQHAEEIACHIILPKCDPVTQKAIHPCREMCWAFIEACLPKWLSLLSEMTSIYGEHWYDKFTGGDSSVAIDCDYLPSLQGNAPCFYKPVTCNSPPDVSNGTKILNATQKDVYQLYDVVQYACVNESFQMEGNNFVTCLYSGEWSTPPTCQTVKEVENSVLKPLFIALPIFLLPLFVLLVVAVVVGIKNTNKALPYQKEEKIQLDIILAQLADNDEALIPLKRKQESSLSLDSPPSLKRNRDYVAFVLYNFDTEHDFVVNSLRPELEEKRNLKFFIHTRDFQIGQRIDANIERAIQSSNNALILMSAGFTKSKWCADEFDHCYYEHVEDPAFKLFVIMMDPVGNLTELEPNMKKTLKEVTYLELEDPEIFPKLYKQLKPDNNGDVNNSE